MTKVFCYPIIYIYTSFLLSLAGFGLLRIYLTLHEFVCLPIGTIIRLRFVFLCPFAFFYAHFNFQSICIPVYLSVCFFLHIYQTTYFYLIYSKLWESIKWFITSDFIFLWFFIHSQSIEHLFWTIIPTSKQMYMYRVWWKSMENGLIEYEG